VGVGPRCLGDGIRWVGDPVDVVTGALVENVADVSVPGEVPITWRRYYSTERVKRDGPLGWGYDYAFAMSVREGVDGWVFERPNESAIVFPYDALERAQEGWRIAALAGGGHELRSSDGTRYRFREGEGAGELGRAERLVGIVRGGGALALAYDAVGRLAEISDRDRERVVAVAWEDGRIISLSLCSHPLRDGRPLALTRYRYDERGDLVEIIDRYGHRRTYSYDDGHRLVARTDRNGYGFEYEYDAAGRCVFAQGEDGVEAVRLRYMPEAQATEVTQADGGAWLHRYDEVGSISEIIDPYGGVRRFEYDAEGRLTAETDAGGNRRVAISGGAGEVTAWVNAAGGVRSADDPTGPPAHRVPQTPAELELGDLASELLRDAKVASPGLEPLLHGGASIFTDLFPERAPRVEASCRRDELGLLVAERVEGASPRRWSYTPNGWVRRYVDHDGGRYEFEFTSWNHRVLGRDPLGRELRYEYTPRHEIAAVIDPVGNRHEYRYDLCNELTAVHHSCALVETYEHDSAGNMIAKGDATGEVLLRYEYGADNLKSRRLLADGEEHRYEYAPSGRFAKIDCGEHTLEFDYSPGGRRTKDLRDGRGVEHRFVAGVLAETRVLERFVTRYRRLDAKTIELEDPLGNKHALVLEHDGVLVRRMACGAREVVQFDSLGRCLGKHLYPVATGAEPWRRRFDYSPEGDLRSVDDSERGRMEFKYDAAHQLAEVLSPEGRGSGEYRYDDAGNLVEAPHLWGVEITEGNKLTRAKGGELEYDQRNNVSVWRRAEGGGRPSAVRELRFLRDSLDRLRRIDGLDQPWSADYDPLGRRMRKSFGEASTEYFWDTDRLAAEICGDGRLRVYIYADDFSLTPWLAIDYDSVDADPASGKLYYLVHDQRGALVAALDANGGRVWSARLDPYGLAEVCGSETLNLSHRLAGQLWDPETGLCYNRFRYYCPELGRYLEEDPAGTGGGINLYAYTNCPLREFDPRGLECVHCKSDEHSTEDCPRQRLPESTVTPEPISPSLWTKILYGKQPDPTKNKIIGGHSPKIEGHPNYAVEVVSTNTDGTTSVKYVTELPNGNLSKIKTSTLAPDSWSDQKIIDTTKDVGELPPAGTRSRDEATVHTDVVDGVEWHVIKDRDGNTTSSYPTGGGSGLPAEFE